MSEFKTVMREKTRMCKKIGDCSKCPLSLRNNKTNTFCDTFIRESPEEADSIIMQWSKENPVMTNRRKFEEVFGFDIAVFGIRSKKFRAVDVNGCIAKWLDEEYKEKITNE